MAVFTDAIDQLFPKGDPHRPLEPTPADLLHLEPVLIHHSPPRPRRAPRIRSLAFARPPPQSNDL